MLVRRVPINKEERLSAHYVERIERAFRVSLGLLLLSGVLLAASFVLAQAFSYLEIVDTFGGLVESKPGTIGVFVSVVGFIVCLFSSGYLLAAFADLWRSPVSGKVTGHTQALVTFAASMFLLGLYLFTWFLVWPVDWPVWY